MKFTPWVLGALGWVAVLTTGCVTGGGGGTFSEIHLFGVPVALNLDSIPGPDGIGVRIYASAPGVARGVVIRSGVLQVLLFEGALDAGELKATAALKVWSLGAAALKPLAAETSLGVGYQLALRWEQAIPRTAVVTVVARYQRPGGEEFWSTPNTVSVAVK